ncbi:MAG: sulfur oxidation c-type cytochrome SoxX [Pseudomonadota bacterium]
MKTLLAAALIASTTIGGAHANAPVAPADVVISSDLQIAESISAAPGDPVSGRDVFMNRKLGNCLACHANADLADQPFHGEVGPVLDGVGGRYPEGLLRTVLVNPKRVFGQQTIMPGFYVVDAGARTADKFVGKTILTAQQLEDVIAYLQTLK